MVHSVVRSKGSCELLRVVPKLTGKIISPGTINHASMTILIPPSLVTENL